MSAHPKKKRKAKTIVREPIKEPQKLLTDALVLGLTASTDERVDKAVALAERIAVMCSEFEIFAAKRDALKRVYMLKGIT